MRCSSNAAGPALFVPAVSTTWTGWIVPRIMPPLTEDTSGESSKSSSIIHPGTELKQRIDPCLLCPDTGLESHPFAAPGSASSDVGMFAPSVTVDDKSQSTALDVYIFPPPPTAEASTEDDNNNNNNNNNNVGPLHIRMDRNSQELVHKTLQRMILSVEKQLAKLLKPKGSKKQKKSKQPRQQHTATNNNNPAATIYRQSTPWDVTNLTNLQVWKEAIATPLHVNLALDNITVSLQVDSCPPTIVSVNTFEHFTSRVFCFVPVVVQVQSLFASHVVVDFYADGQLIAADCTSYTPRHEDIGKTISVLITPKRNNYDSNNNNNNCHHPGQGYEQAYRFEHPVEALPENTVIKLRRGTLWTNPHRRQQPDDENNSPLRVVTYNILADQNAYARTTTGGGKQVSYFPYVELSTLDKRRRMPLIVHEILSYQADIICLQEVDESIWRRLLKPTLEHAGYQGYFSTKVADGMSEGCALLWSLHRFESIPAEDMNYYGLSELIEETIANKHDTNYWKSAADIAAVLEEKQELRRIIQEKLGHVVQMVSLPLKKKKSSEDNDKTVVVVPDRILVANTHLFYHPYGAHIRLMQMYAICQQFERFRKQSSAPYPMILCGDMNSSLRRAAGYLLIHRRVASDHSQIREHFNTYEWRERNTAAAAAAAPKEHVVRVEQTEKGANDDKNKNDWEDFPTIRLPDHFPSFSTGYPIEPAFTHYLDKFVGSLDHIFFSQSSPQNNPYGFVSLQSAPMPSAADAAELVAMPSEKFPSDHVSLVADLEFSCNSKDSSS